MKSRPRETARTILVVDDDRDALDLITRFLRDKGFHVLSAREGSEGLRLARSETIDLILLDVMMPGVSGLDVCAELATDERTAQIPVLLVTACDDDRTRFAGMNLGVSEYLTKPIRRQELYNRVQTQLHGRDIAREIDETIDKFQAH